MMPLDARVTSTVGETKPQCVTEQMDKILNTVIANSLKLMQMEASLRSQSVTVEQLANRLKDIADNTQQSFLEIKMKFEELQLVSNSGVKKVKLPLSACLVPYQTVIRLHKLPCYLSSNP